MRERRRARDKGQGKPWGIIFLVACVLAAISGVVAAKVGASEVPCPSPCYEQLEYMVQKGEDGKAEGGAVGGVYRNGVLSHCILGYCEVGKPYTEDGNIMTPEHLAAVVGCDLTDGVEGFIMLRAWTTDRASVKSKGMA